MNLRSKLLIGYILIASLPLIFFIGISFYQVEKIIINQKTAALESIAESRVNTIKDYIEGFRQDITVAQDYYNIKKNLPILAKYHENPDSIEFIAAKKQLDGQFSLWDKKRSDIADLMLVNTSGQILYSSNPSHQSADIGSLLPDPDGETFKNGQKGVYVSGLFLDKVTGNRPAFLVAAPITDFDGAFTGLVVFEVDTSEFFNLVQDNTGLGKTGEVQLAGLYSTTSDGLKKPDDVVHSGDVALFFNSLRFDPKAAFKREQLFSDDPLKPIQEAVSGHNGNGISLDYRNEKVLAVWRYIPSLNWGLVVKQDYKEIITPINLLLYDGLIIFSILFLFIFLLSWVISKINVRSVQLTEQEKNKLKIIIESIGDAVFVVDANLNLVLLNSVTVSLAGYKNSDNLIGRPYKEVLNFIHEDTGEVNDRFITEAIASGLVQKMSNHTALVRTDGTHLPVLDSASPLKDPSGKILGVVVVFRDATKEREFELTKQEALERANEADRLNRFAVDRELKMIEMKKEIDTLRGK